RTDRVDAREPSHRPRQIQLFLQLFTAVPLHVHSTQTLSAPPLPASRQRRQQHLRDPGSVGLRRLLQQRSPPPLIQLHPHHSRAADRASLFLCLPPSGLPLDLLPVAQLRLQFLAPGVARQALCPLPVGTGAGRQAQRLSTLPLPMELFPVPE